MTRSASAPAGKFDRVVPEGPLRHPASYRDPDSTVHVHEGRILRGLKPAAAQAYAMLQSSGLEAELVGEGLLVASRKAADCAALPAFAAFARVIEHEAIAFISYPHEWPFALLRRAALFHLDVHLRALARGMTLSDASAYNIQFRGTRPVFIDVGSFRPYREGELWSAHRQFCEQFLNPLLLAADFGVAHHAWLRGSLEGVPTQELARLMPASRWLSPRHLFHVLLPARAERHASRHEARSIEQIRSARLPLEAFRMMLGQLRRWITSLTPRRLVDSTTWGDYANTRTYESQELVAKRAIVAEFASATRPGMLFDFGCNDGEFGEVALGAGARAVVGLDADAGALEKACARASDRSLDFLPLHADAANPAPGLGWHGRERDSLESRVRGDAVMALAFVHHLALGRNLPLEEVIDFLVALAPAGLVEFVPKSDPTAQRMLALKGDLFPDYTEERFAAALGARARIERTQAISSTGRTAYWFAR